MRQAPATASVILASIERAIYPIGAALAGRSSKRRAWRAALMHGRSRCKRTKTRNATATLFSCAAYAVSEPCGCLRPLAGTGDCPICRDCVRTQVESDQKQDFARPLLVRLDRPCVMLAWMTPAPSRRGGLAVAGVCVCAYVMVMGWLPRKRGPRTLCSPK
ncbi:hypothetical protein B0J12DRAFT_23090 [Macrophomina phaseolina]|uniref:Uncharacterized protein n=1 Tax=Macrophomina phaseolina TaxID=35725 RepID=A0ABQ8GUU0_9PEZI|nr:hypothetical protein B0J12DRAFT_23090 [Macrophomina phaseolina]